MDLTETEVETLLDTRPIVDNDSVIPHVIMEFRLLFNERIRHADGYVAADGLRSRSGEWDLLRGSGVSRRLPLQSPLPRAKEQDSTNTTS